MAILSREDPDLGKIFYVEDNAKKNVLGVSGKPFVDVSSIIDGHDLDAINDEICYALSKEPNRPLATLAGHPPKELWSSDLPKFENEYLYKLQDNQTRAKIQSKLNSLSEQERRWYLLFRGEITTPWLFSVSLMQGTFLERSNSKGRPPQYESIMDHLPLTQKLIESLPFKSLGRIVIYGSYPGAGVPPHRDWEYSEDLCHQININPGGYRPVYIYDAVKEEKLFLKKGVRAYILNTLDIHGVESVPRFSYTLRVDGTFEEDFFAKISSRD